MIFRIGEVCFYDEQIAHDESQRMANASGEPVVVDVLDPDPSATVAGWHSVTVTPEPTHVENAPEPTHVENAPEPTHVENAPASSESSHA